MLEGFTALGGSVVGAGCSSSDSVTDSTTTTEPDTTTEESTTAEQNTTAKQTFESPLIRFTPEPNQELRRSIREELGEEESKKYLRKHGKFREDSTLFNYETDAGREIGLDLTALEWRHDNDYHTHFSQYRPETQLFVESIDGLTLEEAEKVLEADTGKHGSTMHIDLRKKAEEAGKTPEEFLQQKAEKSKQKFYNGESYKQEEALNAETAGEFLDQTHPLLFNIEREVDNRAISTEDEQFAAAFQEATDRYTDLETHYWAFDLPRTQGNAHGNGLVYDKTNDELRILETIYFPMTAENDDIQHHPLIEDSHYLEEGHEAFERYWHPLRFDGGKPEKEELEFSDGKLAALSMFSGMVTTFSDDDINDGHLQSGIAPTTRYLESFVDALKNYNSNDVEFKTLLDQSKTYHKLYSEDNNAYAFGGTVENPVVIELETEDEARQLLTDQNRTLDYVEDEYVQRELENIGGNESLGEVGSLLDLPA